MALTTVRQGSEEAEEQDDEAATLAETQVRFSAALAGRSKGH